MKVKDLVLYQVATGRNYKVGDIIHFGETYNGQHEKCMNLSFNSNDIPFHKIGYDSLNKGILKNKKLITNMSNSLSDYDFIMREFALEEVRRTMFPSLPSRFKCMFLSETEKTCLNNFQTFKKNIKDKQIQAIKVKVTGEAHFVRDFGISRLGLSFKKYKELAQNYWNQDQNTQIEAKEILFEGKVEILEILVSTSTISV